MTVLENGPSLAVLEEAWRIGLYWEKHQYEERGDRLLGVPLETKWTGLERDQWTNDGDSGWSLCISCSE